ncbi:muscle M-line assembly protein unc-89-like [Uranotaenia lowii]|uniref:muscle M-line assembly protein unc-89-like n=1 Tax=Uranotaenia lowii TaxID=190385 RepID=UPI00247A45F8|nr:muscle M-line assembly protein unc-89-like [Uranotaenia lowii]
MGPKRDRKSRKAAKEAEEVEQVEVVVELTPDPQQLEYLKVPKRGDTPRDFRSLHREKSPFEIGEKPDVQVASQKAIIDKALVMDISGGVTNVDEYISLFFTDSCSLDPASCGDISTVKVEIVEEEIAETEAPKPSEEHEKTEAEAEKELADQQAEQGKSEDKEPTPTPVAKEPTPPPPEPEPAPVEAEQPEEEEEEVEIVPSREPTPPPPPKEPTPEPEPIKAPPTPEYDSDVELIPIKQDFDPSEWKSFDDLEKQINSIEVPPEPKKAKEEKKESSKRESVHEMSERERDLEWQRQRQLMRPPLIISHLKSRAAPLGSTVRLTCTVSGPGITVRWYKNGEHIEKNPRHTFKVSEGLLSLEIKDVEFKDAGEYSCTIKNKNGDTSTATNLTVYEPFETKPDPPTFISIKDEPSARPEPKQEPVAAATQEAPSAEAGPPQEGAEPPKPAPYVYRPKKEKPEKSPPPPQYGDEMARYHHKKILHSRDKLQWSVHLTNRACAAGRRFKLMCAATGFQPELTWYKDNAPLEYNEHIIDMNDLHRGAYGCIWINDISGEDSGTYKCVASNGFEQIETTCVLTVIDSRGITPKCAPVFVPHRTREVYDQVGNILTIEIWIRANPPPTIKWVKGMWQLGLWPDPHIRISQHFDEVAEHNIASLVFYDPTYMDSGEYVCTATNELGEATTVYNLKYSSEEEYFEWLKTKRPSAKLKRELELGIIVADDAPSFDPDVILAKVDAEFAHLVPPKKTDEESSEATQQTDEESDSSETMSKSAEKADIKMPEAVRHVSNVKVPTLPNVAELPEHDDPVIVNEPVKIEPKPTEQTALESKTHTSSIQQEPLYVRKKTLIELGVEELERRQKFDFVSNMPNVRIPLGKTFRLFSYVKCPEPITSVWKHDGRVQSEGLRLSYITTNNGTCVLEVEKSKFRDAGVYTCVAKCPTYGEIEQSCTVTIYKHEIQGEKPVFTRAMKESYNPIKDELYLECTVRGDPTPETIWIVNGTFLHKNCTKYFFKRYEDGRQTLTVFQPQKEDSGRYVCRARNDIDKTDMVHYVNFKNSDEEVIKEFEDELHKKVEKPIRSRHLRPKECEYRPEDDYLIKWSEARNQHEKEYAYNYKLKFITKLKDKMVLEGSNLKFTIYVDGKYPQFWWYKDDIPLVQGRKYRQKQRSDGKATLEIVNVSSDDAGLYKIEVKNYAGSIESQSLVTVFQNPHMKFAPPIFASTILETYSLHSDEIVLECRVRGTPRPNIAWIKDGDYIIPGDKYEQYDHADGTCKLIITKPSEADSGTYTCEAESGGCSDAISHNVQFEGKEKILFERTHSFYHRNPNLPHFYQGLADYSIPAGGNICLVVEAPPNCEVQWFKDKYEVKGKPPKFNFYSDTNGIFALCITAATADASGKYICRATNNFGKAETSSNVDIISPGAIKGGKPPIFMSRPQPEIKIRQGQEISMAFKIQGEPKPKVQWMNGSKDVTNAARTVKEVHDDYIRFSIKEALPTDSGPYFIVARNRYGIDKCFTKITVKYPKGHKKDKDNEDE